MTNKTIPLGSKPNSHEDRLLSRTEVAAFMGIPVRTLTVWAHEGKGPRYRKLGRHVRYLWSDVVAWWSEQDERAGGAR